MIPAKLMMEDSGPATRIKKFEKESAINEEIPVIIRLKINTRDNTFTIGTKEILAN